MLSRSYAKAYGKCAVHSCRQWATTWTWFREEGLMARVYLCKPHFDEWARPKHDRLAESLAAVKGK